MKKYIIFLILFLSSFFIYDKIFALGIYTYEERLDLDVEISFTNIDNVNNEIYQKCIEKSNYCNIGDNTPYSINQGINALINEFNNQNEFDSYFIITKGTNDIEMIIFNKNKMYNEFLINIRNKNNINYHYYQTTYQPYQNRKKYFSLLNGNIITLNMGYSNNFQINNKSYYFYTTNINQKTTANQNYNATNGKFYYKTNWEDLKLVYKSSLPTNYSDGSIFYKNIYYNEKLLFTDNTIIDNKPTLRYKTGFNSNTEFEEEISKINIEFDINEEDSIKNNEYTLFKLQYGANDYNINNIPIFSHFKIYEKNYNSNEWINITGKDYIKLTTEETTFDYVENMISDASITLKLEYNYEDFSLSDTQVLNSQFRIEFYFDNINNGYIYTYDCLNNSIWTDSPKFLENYIYYYFPSNYKYAFIYKTDDYINNNKIYFPTSSKGNGLINLKGQYFNRESKTYSKPINPIIYNMNTYYSYYDFECDSRNDIFVLTRSMGSATYTSYYTKNINENTLNFILSVPFFGLTDKLFYEVNEYTEDTYFYIPIGYNVVFSNGNNITINVNNEFIDLDIEHSQNFYYEIPTIGENMQINDFSNLFDIISNEQNFKNSLFDTTKIIYEDFKNSKLGYYFFIIMASSILILFIRSGKK